MSYVERAVAQAGVCVVWTAGCTRPGARETPAGPRARRRAKPAARAGRAVAGSPGRLEPKPQSQRLNSGRNAIYRPPAASASTQTFKSRPASPTQTQYKGKKFGGPFHEILI